MAAAATYVTPKQLLSMIEKHSFTDSTQTVDCINNGTDSSNSNSTESDKPSIAVIDVRDSDFYGGHIPHAINVPSLKFKSKVEELVQQMRHKQVVVFHCLKSLERGPAAAALFIAEMTKQQQQQQQPQSSSTSWPRVYVMRGGFENYISHVMNDSSVVDKPQHIAAYREVTWGYRINQ